MCLHPGQSRKPNASDNVKRRSSILKSTKGVYCDPLEGWLDDVGQPKAQTCGQIITGPGYVHAMPGRRRREAVHKRQVHYPQPRQPMHGHTRLDASILDLVTVQAATGTSIGR